jgi:hypothetical protein
MTRSYLYRFYAGVDWADIESALLLALWATEGLHGLSKMQLDAEFSTDPSARICSINASTAVGTDLSRIFTSFLLREYGEDNEAFTVTHDEAESAAA